MSVSAGAPSKMETVLNLGHVMLSVLILGTLTPQHSLGFDGDLIAVVSTGKTHTRLRIIRDNPKNLIIRQKSQHKGGKTEELAHRWLTFHRWTSLEHDFRRKEFFLLDNQAGNIQVTVDRPGYVNQTRVLYDGIPNKVTATAYDWIRRELYWGDPSYQAIFRLSVGRLCRGTSCMTSLSRRRQSKTTRRRHRHVTGALETVVGVDVYNPYGMTVDPVRGFLYWCDDGETVSIYSSTLEGDKRTVLVTNLIKPSGMTVDYKSNRLFWVERMSTFSMVSSCNLSSPKCFPRRVTPVYSSQISDIQYYKDSLVMSDIFNRLILYDEDSHEQYRQTWVGQAQGVIVWSKDGQEHRDGSAYRPHSPPSGLVFNDVTTHGLVLLASEKSGILMVERTFAMGPEPSRPYLFWGEVGITTMAVDITRRQLFFFKRPQKTIYKVTIPLHVNDSRIPIVTTCVTSWIDDVTAMAVDWSTGNLYWLDSGYRRLMMSTSTGHYPTVIHHMEISRPQDLVIHSDKKLMFWSDMSDPDPRIERSRLDGRNRRILLSKKDFYERPHALALDLRRNRLYWSDGPFLCRANLNGKLEEDCKPRDLMSRPAIKAIDIMHDYVIWTDFIGGLRSSDTDREFPLPDSRRSRSWFSDSYYSDVIYVHTSKQPDVENTCRTHGLHPEPLIGPKNTKFTLEDVLRKQKKKRRKKNKGSRSSSRNVYALGEISPSPSYDRCSQLCIPTLHIPKCACSVGYWKLHGWDCVPGTTGDYVLLMTDLNTGKLFRQFSLLPHYQVLPLEANSRAFDVTLDDASGKIYWLDNRQHTSRILTSDLNGHEQSVVLAGMEFSMTSIKAAFNLIYILTSSGHVMVLCLTSGLFTDVIDEKDIVVSSLYIDKLNRYLYFSASRKASGPKDSVFLQEETEGVLMRSNLDGSDLRTLYRSKGRPMGLTIHHQHLYWVDMDTKSILTITLPPTDDDVWTTHARHDTASFAASYYGDHAFPAKNPKATPLIPNTVMPRLIIQLPDTSRPKQIVITPDGDIFFTDDTKQALQRTHVKGTDAVEDAGYPYLNKIGGIAYHDSRNKMDLQVNDDMECSGLSIPLPGNQNLTSCLCDTKAKLHSKRCMNKMNKSFIRRAFDQGLCLVTSLQNGKIHGSDVNNYVMSGQDITITCTPGYKLTESRTPSEARRCNEGRWNATGVCEKALGYSVHGNATRGYVVFAQSMTFYVPRDVTYVDVIAIGGGGGGYDPCRRDMFGKNARAGMGGMSKFGDYVKARGGLGGTKDEGGRGGRSRSLFGGRGSDSANCLGGGAAGETKTSVTCELGSTSCTFCGAGGALVKCHKCPTRPGGCSGTGSVDQDLEAADRYGGGATGMNGGWGGGGGGYSRKSIRVSPFEEVKVKVGERGFPSARPAADGVVVVAWGDVIENLVRHKRRPGICKPYEYEDRLVSRDDKCPDGRGKNMT